MYRPGHLVFLSMFVLFSVIFWKWALTGTPLSRVPGAQTLGRMA